jgi:hypothetical protein
VFLVRFGVIDRRDGGGCREAVPDLDLQQGTVGPQAQPYLSEPAAGLVERAAVIASGEPDDVGRQLAHDQCGDVAQVVHGSQVPSAQDHGSELARQAGRRGQRADPPGRHSQKVLLCALPVASGRAGSSLTWVLGYGSMVM